MAVILDRNAFNNMLIKIEDKYTNKLVEILKRNHFLKSLSKNAILKFLI